MPQQKLLNYVHGTLRHLYLSPLPAHLLNTLAMMVTGVFLGHNVQLYEIALWIPLDIQLTSLVRRFERFVADPAVEVGQVFKPFVLAMHACLGHETAYLVIDCTQAGKKCRAVFIGLAYHGTVLPLVWKTVRGNKGHVTGELQKMLLQQVYPYFRLHQRVVVLGDAEYSNEQVIGWLREVGWDFVLRFQSNYLLQTQPDGDWQSAKDRYLAAGVERGQVCTWEPVAFTQLHHFTDLTVTVQWAADEPEMLCLVSSLPASQLPHQVYEMRAWIETLFGNQKSRGFQLARTHMEDPEHLDRLILALAIATCLALGVGTHLTLIHDTRLVDRADRRDLSLFQRGRRGLCRLLALDRLAEAQMEFSWAFTLPPPGFRTAT